MPNVAVYSMPNVSVSSMPNAPVSTTPNAPTSSTPKHLYPQCQMQLYPHHPKQGPNMNVSILILNTKDNCEYPQLSLYNFTPDQKQLQVFWKLKSIIRNHEYPQLPKQLLLSSTAKAAVSRLNFKSNSQSILKAKSNCKHSQCSKQL